VVSLRLVTWTATLAGAFLGAFAALWSGSTPTAEVMAAPMPPRPVAHVQRLEPAERETPPVLAAKDAPPAAASAATAAGPVRERPLPSTEAELETAMTNCARGADDDCLRAAEALQAGRVVAQDEKRARDFRSTAIRRYAVRCNRRDPDACHALSMLHARGFGLKQDAQAAKALLERARVACRTRPATICARL
jgi:TPR repeat protein